MTEGSETGKGRKQIKGVSSDRESLWARERGSILEGGTVKNYLKLTS